MPFGLLCELALERRSCPRHHTSNQTFISAPAAAAVRFDVTSSCRAGRQPIIPQERQPPPLVPRACHHHQVDERASTNEQTMQDAEESRVKPTIRVRLDNNWRDMEGKIVAEGSN